MVKLNSKKTKNMGLEKKNLVGSTPRSLEFPKFKDFGTNASPSDLIMVCHRAECTAPLNEQTNKQRNVLISASHD